MKNIIIVLFFIICPIIAQSQSNYNLNKSIKELRINLPMFFINQTLCLVYEKKNKKNKSYGIGSIINLSGNGMIHNHGWFEIISLKSFYRIYLNRQKAISGFFTNIFGRLVYGENDNYTNTLLISTHSDNIRNIENDKFIDMSIGFDVGQKWVTKKKWTLQLYMGFGKFLFDRDKDLLLKGGITIGKFLK